MDSETTKLLIEAAKRQMRSMAVGRVVAYDHAAQTASVEPLVLEDVRDSAGRREAIPSVVIPDVPVSWPSAGGRALTWSLHVGDLVLLEWRHASHDEVDEGAVAPLLPKATRRFDLSDLTCRPGYTTPGSGTGGSHGQPTLHMPSGEAFHVGDGTAARALALATETKAHLDALQVAHDGHLHPFVGVASGSPGVTSATATTVGPLDPIDSSRILVDE